MPKAGKGYISNILERRGYATGPENSQSPEFWEGLVCGIVPEVAPPSLLSPVLTSGASPIDIYPDISGRGHHGGVARTAADNDPNIHYQEGALANHETAGRGGLMFDTNNSGIAGRLQRLELGNWSVDTGRITILMRCLHGSAFVSGGRFLSKADGTAAADHDWMFSHISSSGNKKRARFTINGTVDTRIATTAIVAGEWDNWGYTYDGADEYLTRGDYHDVGAGVWDSFSKAGSLDAGSTKEIVLMANGDISNNQHGGFAYCFIWNKSIPTDICNRFFADPLKMFQLARPYRLMSEAPAPPAGGRIMGGLARHGGLVGVGGIAGPHGGLAG